MKRWIDYERQDMREMDEMTTDKEKGKRKSCCAKQIGTTCPKQIGIRTGR
jgi:hypothetical protein